MLPRISEHTSIPHISLAVGLLNVSTTEQVKTNQFHPATHNIAIDSSNVVDNETKTIVNKFVALRLHNPGTSNVKDLQELANKTMQALLTNIKYGYYDNDTRHMTVNQKAQFITTLITNVLALK